MYIRTYNRGAAISEVLEGVQGDLAGVRVPCQQDRQHRVADDDAGGEELLPAPERQGRLPVLSDELRIAFAQGHLQRTRDRLARFVTYIHSYLQTLTHNTYIHTYTPGSLVSVMILILYFIVV